MSRLSYSNAKAISALITNKISDVHVVASSRRGYSAASASASATHSMRVVGAPNMMLKKGISEEPAKISWVPDPVTGYYRPENQEATCKDNINIGAADNNNNIKQN